MFSWPFLDKTSSGTPDLDLLIRFKTQVLSDIYKVMQTRMDGYRQSAAAVFIGIVAAAFAIDSALARFLLDPAFLRGLGDENKIMVFVVFVLGMLPTILAGAGGHMIGRLGKYFAEMTSIVYKIDKQNGVFDLDVWLPRQSLYPQAFKVSESEHVGRVEADKDLYGWRDPSIRLFGNLAWLICVVHLLLYGILGLYLWHRG